MVSLIIIYNHNYTNNIERLENIYRDRFSTIYHLVPFYVGDRVNVIPVYERSIYFQGYINQSLTRLLKDSIDHYFFISDDLILNPAINEVNYQFLLGIDDQSSWIESLVDLSILTSYWARAKEAYEWNPLGIPGLEINSLFPSKDEFLRRTHYYNIAENNIDFKYLSPSIKESFRSFSRSIYKRELKSFLSNLLTISRSLYLPNYFKKHTTRYNLVGGYSDIFVVSSKSIKLFSHLSGIFASTNLFVELAIPTALIHSSNNLKTSQDSKLFGKAIWTPKEVLDIELKYESSLEKLFEDFPKGLLYLHPIKLSKWSD